MQVWVAVQKQFWRLGEIKKKKNNDRGAYIFFGNELEHFKMRKSFHNLAYTGLKLGITEWVHHQMIQGIKLSGLKKKER